MYELKQLTQQLGDKNFQVSTTPKPGQCHFTEEDHVIWLKALVSKNMDSENKYNFSKWIIQNQEHTYLFQHINYQNLASHVP